MNHEKFNDAMCRLRQAEEDLNKALRDVYTAINESDIKANLEELEKTVKKYTDHTPFIW